MAAIVPIIVKNFLSIIATAHTIAVGGSFVGNIVFDPSNNDMYVAIPGRISVIDSSTNTVIKTIPFGTDHPFMIAYNPANKEMYVIASNGVTIAHDGVISVIDSSTSTVIKDITRTDPTTGKQFFDIVYNPNDNNMYATCTLSGAGFISIIDSTTDTIVGDMQLPPGPIAGTMAYDLANGDIYVTDTADAVDVIPIAASCNSGAVATAAPSITNANTTTSKAAGAATTATTCKPTADAGQSQTVTEGDKVTLQGSGTGDGTLQYFWTQTAGPAVTLTRDDPTTLSHTPMREFIADPKVFAPMKDTEKKVTFRLVVKDGNGVSSDLSDPHAAVDITVEPLKIDVQVDKSAPW